MVVLYTICFLLTTVVIGLFLFPVLWIADLICVLAQVKKHNGEREKHLHSALAG